MARHKDLRTRIEVTEKIETNKREMEGKETDLNDIVSDLDIVQQTLEQLDFGGLAEGAKEVESSIEGAKNVTKEVFDKEDKNLEQIQNDNEKFEGELQDRTESSKSDLGKISDATAKIKIKETNSELEKAREAAVTDIKFLKEQALRATEARNESKAIQEKLQARVHTGKGGNAA
jgi:hypothetical protein